MIKLKLALVFISFFAVRWWMAGDNTPAMGERVRLTIPTVDSPEYSDSATFIKRGKWIVKIDGYTEFIPGDVVVVERSAVRSVVNSVTNTLRGFIGFGNIRQY